MIRKRKELILRIAAGAGGFVVLLLLVGVGYLQTQDLSPLARPLETALSRALGREVIISGAVRAPLLPRPEIVLDGLFIANAEGGAKPHLLLADRVRAQLGLAGFLRPRIIVTGLRIEGALLNLERLADGTSNAILPAVASGAPLSAEGLPFNLDVTPALVFATGLKIGSPADRDEIVIDRLSLALSKTGPDRIALFGAADGEAFTVQGTAEPLAALLAGSSGDVDAKVEAFGLSAEIKGRLALSGAAEVNLEVAGTTADIAPLMGRMVGWRLGKGAGAVFRARIEGTPEAGRIAAAFSKLGAGDLALEARYMTGSEFTLIGAAESGTFDAAVLAVESIGSGGRLFSTQAFPVAALRSAQIDFGLTAHSLLIGGRDAGTLEVSLWADQGIIAVNPFRLRSESGEVLGDLTFDVRQTPRLALQLSGHGLTLGDPTVAAEAGDAADDRLDFAVELSGVGASPQALIASAYGQWNVVIGEGTLPASLTAWMPAELMPPTDEPAQTAPPEGAAVDGEDAAAPAVQSPPAPSPLPMRCLISRFDIERGEALSRAFYLDTPEATLTGQGTIDLSTESYALRLAPRPKDPRRIAGARDYALSGPLLAPVLEPLAGAPGRGIARATGQAALGIEGFASMMPLLSLSAAAANPCLRPLLSAEEAREAKAMLLAERGDEEIE